MTHYQLSTAAAKARLDITRLLTAALELNAVEMLTPAQLRDLADKAEAAAGLARFAANVAQRTKAEQAPLIFFQGPGGAVLITRQVH